VSLTRRDVLRAAAAAPFLFGLEGCSRSPSWFADALRRIRMSGRPGFVIRLPKDPGQRCVLGHQVARFATTQVVVCLETEDMDRLLFGAEGADRVWIDAEGRVLRTVDPRLEPAAQPGPPALPYGVSIGTAARCEETPACSVDSCAFCGMGAVAPRAGQFIKFLAK
jgi:hypothetical protein